MRGSSAISEEHKKKAPPGTSNIRSSAKTEQDFPAKYPLLSFEMLLEKPIGLTVLLRDITERKRAEKEMAHFAAIVESSQDAIISKTLDGVIISWNPGAETLYGYRAEEAIGQPISFLLPADRPDEIESLLAKLQQGEKRQGL